VNDARVASGEDRGTGTGEERLADFLLERLGRQYDWNVGLNARASILVALSGIALSLLVGTDRALGEGPVLEVVARVGGLLLIVVSAGILLHALRRRPEAVWGGSDLSGFVAECRGADGEQVSGALVDRLLGGTDLNEKVLSSKSREIQRGTILTFVGLAAVALGSVSW